MSAIHIRLHRVLRFKGLQTACLLVTAASFVLFYGVTRWAGGPGGSGAAGWSARVVYLGFYIWLGAAGTLLGPNMKLIAHRLYPPASRGRTLAISAASIGVGGLGGCGLACVVAPWLVQEHGLHFTEARDTLLLGMGGVLALAVPTVLRIDQRIRREGRDPEASEEEKKCGGSEGSSGSGLAAVLRLIANNARLRRIAGLVLVGGLAEAVLLYLFYWIVTEETTAEGGRALVFGRFYMYLNGAVLLMLVVGSSRLVDRIGLLTAILTLPLGLAVGTAALLVHAGLIVAYALRIAEKTAEKALYGHGVDRMMICVDDPSAASIRAVLEGVGRHAGRGLGALVLLGVVQAMSFSIRQTAVLYLIILVGWAAMAWLLRPILRDCSVHGEPSA